MNYVHVCRYINTGIQQSIKSVEFYIILKMETLTLFLFLVAINVDSKDKLPSRRTQIMKKSFYFDANLLSRQFVCFLFLSLSMLQATNNVTFSFFLSFSLSFFLSLKIITKNARDLTFCSFFLPSFLSFISSFCFHFNYFFKDYNKKVRDLTFSSFFLSFCLSFFLSFFL